MDNLYFWLGIALTALVVVAPISHCTYRAMESSNLESTTLQKACIEARGEWKTGWGGRCIFPENKAKE